MPPALPLQVVMTAVAQQFGLVGDFAPLVSERDQNFCLTLDTGRRFVVKVTSLQEAAATSDLQIGALLHLEGAEVEVPSVVRTLDGTAFGFVHAREGRYRLRVVTWIDGDCLQAAGIDVVLAAQFGEALARLDSALSNYTHAGENPVLLWDLQRAGELRPLLEFVDDADIRDNLARVVDDFDTNVIPAAAKLPVQVIHGDANPENVLVTKDGIGFIDFGDMVRAPRIFDIAIAAAYLRCAGDDPLGLMRPFIGAYHSAAPFRGSETDLLFDLVRARLATTVTLLYWRLRDRAPEDEYRCKSLQVERTASRFLGALERMGRATFDQEIKSLLAERRQPPGPL